METEIATTGKSNRLKITVRLRPADRVWAGESFTGQRPAISIGPRRLNIEFETPANRPEPVRLIQRHPAQNGCSCALRAPIDSASLHVPRP